VRPTASLPNHAVLIHVEEIKLPVAAGHLHLDPGGCPRSAGSHFGHSVFEPVRQINPRSVLPSGVGVDNRRSLGLHQSGDIQPCNTGLDINPKLDGRVKSVQYLRRGAVVDKEVRGPRGRRLAVQNFPEGLC